MNAFDFETPLSCVIFDCDGTLVDSEVLCQMAMVEVFAHYGVTLDLQECLDNFQGGKLADILMHTCERYGLAISLDELEPLYRDKCAALFETKLKPVTGVPDLINMLENIGVDICVASNGPVSKMEMTLQLTGLMPHFRGKLFSAFDANSWKPAPDLLHYSAMNMAAPIHECLFVDDTLLGVEAGINAGIRTIYFNTGNKEDVDHPLVRSVHSMDELSILLEKLPLCNSWA
ncbi:6-phosphogluconate phosphatase [Enterovibrio sp. ZSDZ35]|uniref:6-phosphogluconate phosphatase n=1 Tax=Enterovibrio qingdaonensis TaxID=2899818 RepID=A0ABT5QJR7_9GAMM|nr:6-phosphogluconate phosphatase [Enterovibrio sp. ZSDZ35]MDD1781224.1 6-phosphogluconate phosphatase [Enterovibrio sp. ZSDZ35]